MRWNQLLSEKKSKNALLKNSKNLKEIYEMYWERRNYEIVVDNIVKIEQKFKYKVLEILKKFKIHSTNELTFLLMQIHEPIKNCEFCKKDIYSFELRSTTYHNDCSHIGICFKCKNLSTYLDDNGYCLRCDNRKNIYSDYLDLVLNLIQYGENEIKEFDLDNDKLKWIINFLENKLNIFNKLHEENSHGCDNRTNRKRLGNL